MFIKIENMNKHQRSNICFKNKDLIVFSKINIWKMFF